MVDSGVDEKLIYVEVDIKNVGFKVQDLFGLRVVTKYGILSKRQGTSDFLKCEQFLTHQETISSEIQIPVKFFL